LGVLLAAMVGCAAQEAAPVGSSGMAGTVGTGGTIGTGGAAGIDPTGTGGTGGTPSTATGPYQPLVMNATWTYLVNEPGLSYEKNNVVEALEDLGGIKAGTMAYRVREMLPTETQLTWYQPSETVVMRHREQALDTAGVMKSESWFSPYRLRLDETTEHTAAGATWNATFTENHTSRSKPAKQTTKTETWTVMAAEESVTVPAGTFNALRVSRTDQSDGSIKTFWFVRGIGKVKETTATGHTEELSRYNIPQ
jgi:hypothetical protein